MKDRTHTKCIKWICLMKASIHLNMHCKLVDSLQAIYNAWYHRLEYSGYIMVNVKVIAANGLVTMFP